jgi:histidine triad (HIT) family protein
MSDRDPSCLFCKIVAGEIPSQRVYESDEIVAFKDIHPQAPFHCLVIPKVHRATLKDFRDDERGLAGGLLLVAKQIAAEQRLAGYRVAMNVDKAGGQVVFHVHLHLLGGRQMKGELG